MEKGYSLFIEVKKLKIAILKIHCLDHKGIIDDLSKLIFEMHANVLEIHQHKEDADNQFFMFIKFDISELNVTHEALEKNIAAAAESHEFVWTLNYRDTKKKMAIMVSKYDHCLYDLLLRHQYGELNCDVSMIISNHPDLEKVAKHFNVPYFFIPRSRKNQEEADLEALKLLKQHFVDFVVLARYMQILTPVLLTAFPEKIINVHHGFLPAFKGAKPYHQAFDKGVKIIGATSHYANEELDMGPIIAQETEHVNHGYSVGDMIRIGRDTECKVLERAVKAHIDDRILVYKGRTIIFV
jgi:formyltetrahydrofolate deformylase